jgi:ABC-type polysaccharide/polyol phosphate transport system ATPase subunit
MAAVLAAVGLSKSFSIPSVRRDTVREHFFGLLQPRRIERLQVLNDVSFEVRQGETLGIMGRNGSGKSTLLKILCGIYPADRGRVITRAGITPILELGVGWNPELDAIDNVYLIGSVMGLSLADIRSGMDEILTFAELERFANLQLKHYSSGMASRLAYAVAFQAVREVLILDEIFAVGDAGFKAKCEQRYERLHAQGHTVILVSHDPRVALTFCSRAILLDSGGIAVDGSPDTVIAAYTRASFRGSAGGE